MACETDGVDGFEVGAVEVATLVVDEIVVREAIEGVTCGDGIDAGSSDCAWFQSDSCGMVSGRGAEKLAEAFHASWGAVGGGTESAVIQPSCVDT